MVGLKDEDLIEADFIEVKSSTFLFWQVNLSPATGTWVDRAAENSPIDRQDSTDAGSPRATDGDEVRAVRLIHATASNTPTAVRPHKTWIYA